LEAVYTRQA